MAIHSLEVEVWHSRLLQPKSVSSIIASVREKKNSGMADTEKLKSDALTETHERQRLLGVISACRDKPKIEAERSLSKATKALNRIKKFYAEKSVSPLITELTKLDLSMYLEELIAALCEAFNSMKLKDTFLFLEICSNMSPIYREFGNLMVSSLRKQFSSLVNDNLRLRIYIRTLTEFYLLRIGDREMVEDELVSIFESDLACNPADISSQIVMIRLTAMSYWVGKYSECVVMQESVGIGERLGGIIRTFYAKHGPHLLERARNAVVSQEKINTQAKIDKGTIDAENESKLAGLLGDECKLLQHLSVIQTLMNLPNLELPRGDNGQLGEKVIDSSILSETLSDEVVENLQFADETEKSFYLDLVDVSVRLPSGLLQEDSGSSTSNDADMKVFLAQLISLDSREKADELALRWYEAGLNSKGNRKQLFQYFSRADVAPVHVRFLATIHPYSKDIVTPLVDDLKTDALRKYHQKAIQLIGELIKFSLCPLGVGLEILQSYVNDFSARSAEAAAWFLVACGRFLINQADVGSVVDTLVGRLIKLTRSANSMPAKVVMAVEDSYYQTKPKKVVNQESTLSPIEKYIEYLINVEMYRMEEDEFLRLVKRLPWSGQGELVRSTIKRVLLDLGLNTNFVKVYCIASLLAGLIKFEEVFVIHLIDDIMEQFQVGIEKDDFRQSPSRVRLARLIGELYSFKLIDSNVVMDILYLLIGFRATSSFGASEHTVLLQLMAESASASSLAPIAEECDDEINNAVQDNEFVLALQNNGALDEPNWSYMRINLVSTIIMTVGEFFQKGPNRKKMLRFLVLFRRYVLVRQVGPLPVRVVNVISDMFDLLQVKGYDIRTDSIKKIDMELDLIREDLSKLAAGRSAEEDLDSATAEVMQVESQAESSETDELSDKTEYERESDEHEIDEEISAFDKEMQSLMLSGMVEARSNLVIKTRQLVQLPLDSSNDGEEQANGTIFKVLSRGKSGKAQTVGVVEVPEDHKLRKGQETFKIEQEAARLEKQQLKKFIMAYERASNHPETVPATGHAVTLGQAAGLRPGDKITTGPRNRQRKFFN